MTALILNLILGFFPEPATYFTDRLKILKSHKQRPRVVHLSSATGVQQLSNSSPGVLGAWIGLMTKGNSVQKIAEACGVELTGAVKPRLLNGRVLLELATSGWVLNQDTGLPVQLVCGDERLSLFGYGQGQVPLLFPERLELETRGERRSYRVVKIEF